MLCLFAGGVSATTAVADEPVISNVDLMSRLTGETVEEILAKLSGEISTGDITLVPYTVDERYDFLDNVFTRVLTSSGYRVLVPGSPAAGGQAGANRSPGGYVIEYQATEFSLAYPKIYRSYLIGGRRVKRSADVTLLARVIDPSSDSVVWLGEARRSHEDQFSYGQLPDVEAGVFEFSKPPRKSTPWGKVAEPVMVSGIIVGLIYLFFSNQTDQ
jgi:hypothetical protein